MNIALRLPLDPPYTVTQAFGENPEAYARFGQSGHNGLDFAIPEGTPVMAAADGIVDRAMFDPGGYGNYVRVYHGGYSTLYGHLSRASVTIGNKVKAGDVIGYSGNTGNSTGPHLHFELRDPSKIRAGWPQGAISPSGYFVATEPDAPPIVTDPPVQPPTGDTVTVIVDGLNVRLAPSLSGVIVGMVTQGTTFQSGGEPLGSWQPVTCYVWRAYVR